MIKMHYNSVTAKRRIPKKGVQVQNLSESIFPINLSCASCYQGRGVCKSVGERVYFGHQCITIRQRTARYRFVHPNTLFLCTFLSIIHSCHFFACCIFFLTMCFFHVQFFSCYTRFCWTLVKLHYFNAALFSCCNFLFCTLYMLRSFHA